MSEVVDAIRSALAAAADDCLARVRQPDADHRGEWVCTWGDALDVVDQVIAERQAGLQPDVTCFLDYEDRPGEHDSHDHLLRYLDGRVLLQQPADSHPHGDGGHL